MDRTLVVRSITCLFVAGLLLLACQPATTPIEVTRVVEVTREVTVEPPTPEPIVVAPEVPLPTDYRTWFHLGSKSIRSEGATALGLPVEIFGNTFDAVYANPVALEDLRNNTRPFRDGAMFVAPFFALETPVEGVDAAGALLFTAVMEKNARWYSETGGWGFEAFDPQGQRLTELRPACYGCHQQQADNDLVFSTLKERAVDAVPADDNGVYLPPNYRTFYHIGSKAITPEGAEALGLPPEIFGNTFDAVYANRIALAAMRSNERPFPQGSLLVADFHTLETPVAGVRAYGEQAFTAVMLKKAAGQGDSPTTGDWGFTAFDATGQPLTDLRPACIGCHAAQEANDYVFSTLEP